VNLAVAVQQQKAITAAPNAASCTTPRSSSIDADFLCFPLHDPYSKRYPADPFCFQVLTQSAASGRWQVLRSPIIQTKNQNQI
jgi:hypothetical protein